MKRRDFIKSISLASAAVCTTKLYAINQLSENKNNTLTVLRPKCKIPVIYDVDVLVVGGTSGGVAAAVEAARQGAKVCLITGDTYLGTDICGTYNLWQHQNKHQSALANKIWCKQDAPPNPLHVKTVLDQNLIENDIPFLLSTNASNILFDENNHPAGVIIANRSGEQIITSKIIIDAGLESGIAMLAGAEFSKYRKGKRKFIYRVLGNKPNVDLEHKTLSPEIKSKDKSYTATEYYLNIQMKEKSFAQYAEAMQLAIDKTWDNNQVDASDILLEIPLESIMAKGSDKAEVLNTASVKTQCFQPSAIEGLFVLNAYANISTKAKKQMLTHSDTYIRIGTKIGKIAANQAKNTSIGAITGIGKHTEKQQTKGGQSIEQYFAPMRKQHHVKTLAIEAEAMPVWEKCDVLVVGGGTAGAPAAIAAGRNGAKTLVVENAKGLGGMGTLGMIGAYFHGFREGFTKEIDRGVRALGGEKHPRQRNKDHHWVKDWKMEWYRKEIKKTGGNIWFGAIACGAVVEKNTVKGIVVSTPTGKGIVLAHKIIDATGSADIAIAAGAKYQYIDKDTLAVQGAGLPMVNPDNHYNNTDWTFINDTDIFDITRTFTVAKKKFSEHYDIGKIPQTRERRRVVADYQVTALDMLNNRTYPDSISYHVSSFDTHGFTVSPIFTIHPPEGAGIDMNAYVPIRSLLPKGLENIIVTGLGADAHRDAMPVIRMQPCLQNQGYSVGILAAMCAKSGESFRKFDIKILQKQLVDTGNLQQNVLTDKDNYPTNAAKIQQAIDKLKDDMQQIHFVLWNKEMALPLVKQKLKATNNDEEKLICAYILGLYGYDDGWKILQNKIDSFANWDKGWNYRGMGQFGMSSSYLDGLVMALGLTKKQEALPSIIRLAEKLDINSAFSHFRAIALAFESIKSAEAVDVLIKLLDMPGMKNFAVTDIDQALFFTVPHRTDTSIRNKTLREIVLARALYRCGDKNNTGKNILVEYSNDLRGIYSLHATGVLSTLTK